MKKFFGHCAFYRKKTIYQKCSFAKITNSLPAPSINNEIGKRFIKLLKVESTNNYAMQQVKKGVAKHGDAYFAIEQTAGKGQYNRQWLSPKGENIILSVVFDMKAFAIDDTFILNMLAALSAQELFNKYSAEKAKIKWANDIYWRDRKTAGILIENTIRGKTWQYAVVGFGMNINQTVFAGELKNPVSLKQITGKAYNVIELAKQLCSIINTNMQQLMQGNNTLFFTKYNNELYKLNETIQFKKNNVLHSGRIKGVDRLGRLIIEDKGEHAYENGSIEWLLS